MPFILLAAAIIVSAAVIIVPAAVLFVPFPNILDNRPPIRGTLPNNLPACPTNPPNNFPTTGNLDAPFKASNKADTLPAPLPISSIILPLPLWSIF